MLCVLHAGRDHLPTTNATVTLIKCNDRCIPALLPRSLQGQKGYVCSAEKKQVLVFPKQQNAKGKHSFKLLW